MAAMLFVKGGAMTYIRAATNVQKSDDSGRAIGTTLAGDPLESIKRRQSVFAARCQFSACPTSAVTSDQGCIGCSDLRLFRRLQKVTATAYVDAKGL